MLRDGGGGFVGGWSSTESHAALSAITLEWADLNFSYVQPAACPTSIDVLCACAAES